MPRLEMTVDGINRVYTPKKDAYVSYANINSGYEESILRIRESGMPVSSESKRAFMDFDLSDIEAAGRITDAVLKFYISSEASTQEQKVMIWADGAPDSQMTWKSKVKNLYSWQGATADQLNWTKPPYADAEFQYIVTRFPFITRMAYEFYCTGDEYFAYNAIRLILHFNYKYGNAVGTSSNVQGGYPRSLDTACRMSNILQSLPCLFNSVNMTPQRYTEIAKNIWISGNFLTTVSNPVNWGVIETVALQKLINDGFPEFSSAPEWHQRCVDRAREMSINNTFEDGTYKEDSSGYTMVALGKYLDLRSPYDNSAVLGEDYDEMLTDVSAYTMSLMTPVGDDPKWGDTDSANEKNRNGTMDSAWKILSNQQILYWLTNGTEGTAPPYTSVLYPAKKMVVQRTGWKYDDLYLMMEATKNAGNHSHRDDLSVIVAAYGKTLLTDQGRYSYDATDPIGEWITSVQAHNTVDINGASQSSITENEINYFITNNGFDFCQASEKVSDVGHSRYVFFLRPNYWVVSDVLVPDNSGAVNTYNQTWHSSVNFVLNENKEGKSTFGDDKNIQVVPLDPMNINASTPVGYYANYGNATAVKYLSYEKAAAGTVTFDTVLYPNDQAKTVPFEAGQPLFAGSYSFSIETEKYNNDMETLKLIAAIYDEKNNLMSVLSDEKSVSAFGKSTVTFSPLTIPGVNGVSTVKVFVWNSLNELRPLTSALILPETQ